MRKSEKEWRTCCCNITADLSDFTPAMEERHQNRIFVGLHERHKPVRGHRTRRPGYISPAGHHTQFSHATERRGREKRSKREKEKRDDNELYIRRTYHLPSRFTRRDITSSTDIPTTHALPPPGCSHPTEHRQDTPQECYYCFWNGTKWNGKNNNDIPTPIFFEDDRTKKSSPSHDRALRK